MTASLAVHLLDLLDHLGTGCEDETLFRQRQALVAAAGLDEATIEAAAGFLFAARLGFVGNRFDHDLQGVEMFPAFVVGALDAGERLVDAVAWPIGRPRAFASLLGTAAVVGLPQLTYLRSALASPPPVFRTPQAWVRAGMIGCATVDPLPAARLFLDLGGSLQVEDDAHGRELDADRREMIRRGAAFVVQERRAA